MHRLNAWRAYPFTFIDTERLLKGTICKMFFYKENYFSLVRLENVMLVHKLRDMKKYAGIIGKILICRKLYICQTKYLLVRHLVLQEVYILFDAGMKGAVFQ